MSATNWINIFKKYRGLWVAVEGPNSNKVVASGKDLKKVVKEAQKKGFDLPLITQIPQQVLPIVGVYRFK